MNVGTAEPGWRPDEFGLRRALLLACLPVVGGVALVVALLADPAVPPLPVMVQLIEPAASASLAPATAQAAEPELATAAPPEPQAATAIPATTSPPVPAEASAPAPLVQTPSLPELEQPALADSVVASSDIPVPPTPALAPPQVARPSKRPATARPRPMHRASPAQAEAAEAPAAAALPTQAPAPREDVSSGIGAYRAGLHAQIERNMLADESVRRLGIGGIATIEAVIAPDGRVLSAVVARSSGNRTIDRAAQAAVQRGGYRAFGPHMPPGPITISVPITVDG